MGFGVLFGGGVVDAVLGFVVGGFGGGEVEVVER